MIRTPDGTIRFWNKGAERLHGWRKDDTLGKRSHNLLKTLFPKPLPGIEQELTNMGFWEGELIHIRRDGSRMAARSRWELRYEEATSVPTVLEINYAPSVA
jgi:PAS domain S-box-containing protein